VQRHAGGRKAADIRAEAFTPDELGGAVRAFELATVGSVQLQLYVR
jgi:hypothetical protein